MSNLATYMMVYTVTRAEIEEKHGKLTDKQWQKVVDLLRDNSDINDFCGGIYDKVIDDAWTLIDRVLKSDIQISKRKMHKAIREQFGVVRRVKR